jgi:1-acyl-sn-glycerol-3-phosphate acyltransferase
MLRLISEGALLAVRRRVRSGIRVAYGLYAWFAFAVLAVPLSAFMVLPWSRESAWHAVHVAARRLIGAWRMPVTLHDETGGRLPAAHVIVANHCSYLDTLVIGSVLRQPHVFVAKAQLQWVPLLGRCMRRTGTLFIERFEPVQSASEVDRMKRELIGGRSLVVFAEGTFTSVTGLRAFHLGAFQAAAAGNMPVIPLALRGTRTALRDGQWLPRRGSIDVAIGPPLTPPGDKDVFAAAVELRDAARDYILRHCGEPDLG